MEMIIKAATNDFDSRPVATVLSTYLQIQLGGQHGWQTVHELDHKWDVMINVKYSQLLN